ncbi:type II toxin-antitoxin system RelB/DinJ family antitoxin [Citrobacter freundii]|uniref:type II toxin-antitoxin system RelB/DinJ family antitoxin n=1 Tax=Citrobacter freundii TaxID=546 RepID=UPI0019058783|nr:type II toxin-antitoxin system RelB/DinJ family antitoxin [Citrobacter freundii]MBJ8840712.1 type II toxin-antitoxin system RelB/DinJ family antitoxin [Citrobacter freundii]
MMAAINIKIDDNLKDTGDAILRELGLNATQYITLCWQYLAQHRKLPFMTETKILTALLQIVGGDKLIIPFC